MDFDTFMGFVILTCWLWGPFVLLGLVKIYYRLIHGKSLAEVNYEKRLKKIAEQRKRGQVAGQMLRDSDRYM